MDILDVNVVVVAAVKLVGEAAVVAEITALVSPECSLTWQVMAS